MHHITVVGKDVTAREVAGIMSQNKIGSVLVEVGDELYGIVTESDLVCRVLAAGLNPDETSVQGIMTHLEYTVDAEAEIYEISEIFSRHDIRRLPVVEDGRIIGILTTRDVATHLRFRNMARIFQARKMQGGGLRNFR